MELKKNPEVDPSKKRGLYFAIGLAIATSLSYFAINYKSAVGEKDVVVLDNVDKSLEEDVEEFTEEEMQEPEPAPAPPEQQEVAVDDIKEVEDNIKVESNIAGTDTSDDDKVPEQPKFTKKEEVVPEEEIDVPFAVIEEKPVFPGCENLKGKEQEDCFKRSLDNHVKKNFKYPEDAQELGQQGRVTVLFKITKDGTVEVTGVRGPSKSLENEARRIIEKLPRFKPGRQRNKPVGVPYAYPIVFKLNT